MRRTAVLLCCVAALAGMPASAELPGWLAGDWTRPSRDGVVRESWRAVSPRTLEGESWFEAADGTRRPLESFLLAEMGDGVYFIPRPRENPLPVAFRLVEATDRRVVFENPEHDFPTTIAYELREDGSLLAWIAGPDGDGGERRVEFPFAPAGDR